MFIIMLFNTLVYLCLKYNDMHDIIQYSIHIIFLETINLTCKSIVNAITMVVRIENSSSKANFNGFRKEENEWLVLQYFIKLFIITS